MSIPPDDDATLHGWVTIGQARAAWPDAPRTDTRLIELLTVSHEVCSAYAPTLAADATVPARYREAQILHARATWRAARVSDTGDIGMEEGGYAIPTTPLDGTVKQLLRPPTSPVAIG